MVVITEVVEGTVNGEYEIDIPETAILRHICHPVELGRQSTSLRVIDANQQPLPVWPLNSFYLANIGESDRPLFLELRFEEASEGLWIALLMTNERTPRDLEMMAQRLIERIYQKGIDFKAVIGVEASGSKISQEIARLLGPDTLQTTFQKGKPRIQDGELVIGPPKEWVDPSAYILVSSGTSGKAPQAIFMDQKIARVFGDKPTAIVDEARLTSGTINSSIELARMVGINPACVVTILNEAEPTEEIMGVPYVNLVKLPVFSRNERGFQPVEGSFDGVDFFYQEI